MTTFGEAVALDTTIVIQHLRYPALVAEKMADFPRLYLPFAALGELHLGIYRSANSDRNLAKLRKFLENVAILRCEDSTCAEYGRIAARLTSAGKLIPQNDIWIAACAIERKLPLATSDQHFKNVEGLTVLNW